MTSEFNEFDSIVDASSLAAEDSRELIARARGGSDRALSELISSLQGYLLVVANQQLSPELRTKLGASDLVQSVLLRADQNLAEFRGDSRQTLLAWLGKIMTNELIAAHRKYQVSAKRDVQREVPIPSDSGLAEPLVARDQSPGSKAEANEEAIRLRSAVGRLSEDHRTVVLLRSWEQLPFDEIGHRMGRSADAAKKLWRRAIQQLEKELKDG